MKPLSFIFWERKNNNSYKIIFHGLSNGKKVFVKMGINDLSSENEIAVLELLKQKNVPLILFPLVSLKKTYKKSSISFIMFPFINMPKLGAFKNLDSFIDVCNQAVIILDHLYECNIVHADILSRNIFASGRDLLLFDFDESMSALTTPTVSYRNHGSFKRYFDGFAILDDAHSFSKVIERLTENKEWLSFDCYKNIINRIGRICIYYSKEKTYVLKDFHFDS